MQQVAEQVLDGVDENRHRAQFALTNFLAGGRSAELLHHPTLIPRMTTLTAAGGGWGRRRRNMGGEKGDEESQRDGGRGSERQREVGGEREMDGVKERIRVEWGLMGLTVRL